MLRRLLKTIALLIGLLPVALFLFVWAPWSAHTSLAVIAPPGVWILVAIFLGPIALAFVLWRVAGLINPSE
jgi:hypothetical protein